MRDHEPIVIEAFNGWWIRDDDVSAPLDHFNTAENIQFFDTGVETRYPLDKYQGVSTALDKVLRTYDYVTQTGQTLLVLVEGGFIYHVTGPDSVYPVILTISGMTDFAFVAIAGRAYISPFTTYIDANGQSYELGLPNEHLYVYNGDGTPARKAGGTVPSNANLTYPHVPPGSSPENPPYPKGEPPFIGFNDINDGVVTKGVHIIGVSFNVGAGFQNMSPASDFPPYLNPPFANHSMFPVVNAPGGVRIQLNNIPIGPPGTAQRMICMTKAVDPNNYVYNDARNNAYYPIVILSENTSTTYLINVSDASLPAQFEPVIGSPFSLSHAMMPVNSATAGFSEPGFHLVGVIFETNTGYLSPPGPEFFGGNTNIDPTKKVMILNIPLSTDPNVVKRHLVSTKTIQFYNGDQKGYQFFFIPGGTLNDNTTRAMEVSYYDADLLSDASHLIDNFLRIPAGVALTTYHSRLVLVGDPTIPDPATLALSKRTRRMARSGENRVDNRSVAWVSAPGEPESINQVDGLIVVPLDGNPLTNCQEFRDALYLFKRTRTYGYVDNLDEPSTWNEKVIDQGVGCPVHGIATVLDSGGANVDSLMIADWSGIMLFNGVYARPELTWKIEQYWLTLFRNGFGKLQISNDSIGKKIYISMPSPLKNHVILMADYRRGLDAKNIRWAKWIFDAEITSVCLINTNKVIIGAGDDTGEAGVGLGGIYYINPFKSTRHDSYKNGVEKKIPNPLIHTSLLGD